MNHYMDHYEIEAAVIRAKNGDQAELLKLMEHYKPFIIKTARRFYIKNYDLHDLIQIGYIAVMNAVAKYKIGSNTFTKYATKAIKNYIVHTLVNNSKYKDELSLNNSLMQEENVVEEFIDYVEGGEEPEKVLVAKEEMCSLRKAIGDLPEDEKSLIINVYYKRIPLTTYAVKNGLTYKQARRRKDKALRRLNSIKN
ncbi:sigma-70 family RNA polymerase sigma factor [Clostridium thermarum]|uniref:sigma-70 family RNA polymerase sigma factor n=1 Tax=Clostridium thermarum TaxID=1716543 RepID=UPI0013D655E8|nr:sigma-70 family RNA polymerase sigma factor [Clostridium thermarum]